jgi:hypothetical protein
MRLADRGGRQTSRRQPCHPCDHIGVRHVREPDEPPGGQHLNSQDALVPRPGGRLEVALAFQPARGSLPHRDARHRGIHLAPGLDGGCYPVEPELRVYLAGEVLGVLRPSRVAIPGAPTAIGPFRDVCHQDPLSGWMGVNNVAADL